PLASRDKWNAYTPSQETTFRQTEVISPEIPALVDLLYGTNTSGSGVVARALKPFPTTNRLDLELVLYKGIPVNPITGPNFTTVIGGGSKRGGDSRLLPRHNAIPPHIYGLLPDMKKPRIPRVAL